MNSKKLFCAFLIMAFVSSSRSQTEGASSVPDTGLGRHPFLYAGEWQNHAMKEQTMYIVKNGSIVWSYTMHEFGEFSDATMLSNGNILFAHFSGITEITPDKKVVWNYDAPESTQIHSCQPIGNDTVFFCQNGLPAKAILMNIKTGTILMEHVLDTKSATDPKTIHGQFRHIRMTNARTYLIAHLDLGKVVEYDENWNPIWSVPAPSAWAAVRLKNGNTLISGNQHGYVREVDPTGKVVWEINKDDLPGIHLYTVQQVERCANGNTVICNWFGGVKREDWPTVVQVIEVTPEKKVVWALKKWSDPDLGPASSIQLLDEPGIPERGGQQR